MTLHPQIRPVIIFLLSLWVGAFLFIIFSFVEVNFSRSQDTLQKELPDVSDQFPDFQSNVLMSGKKVSPEAIPITMVAVGDVMVGRFVERLMNKYGKDYPFIQIDDFLDSAAIVFGNLEGPIVTNHSRTPDFSTTFSFSQKTATLLAERHFTVLSLANNHMLDQGQDGYFQTKKHLSESGIDFFGHPREFTEDYLAFRRIQEKEFVFVGLNEVQPSFDLSKAFELISSAASNENQFVIVSIHWGTEYALRSNQKQRELAHGFIDRGADLILGHHPHVVQEIEVYNDRLIFYSLGNFIFDQYFSRDTQEGLAVRMVMTDKTLTYHLVPIQIIRSQARIMDEENRGKWLENLAQRSNSEIQTQIMKGSIAIDL